MAFKIFITLIFIFEYLVFLEFILALTIMMLSHPFLKFTSKTKNQLMTDLLSFNS